MSRIVIPRIWGVPVSIILFTLQVLPRSVNPQNLMASSTTLTISTSILSILIITVVMILIIVLNMIIIIAVLCMAIHSSSSLSQIIQFVSYLIIGSCAVVSDTHITVIIRLSNSVSVISPILVPGGVISLYCTRYVSFRRDKVLN